MEINRNCRSDTQSFTARKVSHTKVRHSCFIFSQKGRYIDLERYSVVFVAVTMTLLTWSELNFFFLAAARNWMRKLTLCVCLCVGTCVCMCVCADRTAAIAVKHERLWLHIHPALHVENY